MSRPEPVTKAAPAQAVKKGRPKEDRVLASREFLGKVSDGDLAQSLGVSSQLVANVRHKLGIDAFEGKGRPRGRSERKEKARSEVPGKRGVRTAKKPGLAAHHELMGKMPDAEVARRTRVSRTEITAYRLENDIPAFQYTRVRDTAPPPSAPKARRERASPVMQLLDEKREWVTTRTNGEVADRFGISRQSVANYRALRGLGAAPGRRASANPAAKRRPEPAAEPPSTPAVNVKARGKPVTSTHHVVGLWVVTLVDRDLPVSVQVAADGLVAACQLAMSRFPSERIGSVKFVGDVVVG